MFVRARAIELCLIKNFADYKIDKRDEINLKALPEKMRDTVDLGISFTGAGVVDY